MPARAQTLRFSVQHGRRNTAPGVHAQTSSDGADDEGRHRSHAGTEPPADRATHGRTEESEELGHALPDHTQACTGDSSRGPFSQTGISEGFRSWSSIQDVPNLSRSMAKRDAKKVSSIFMKI